MYDDVHNGLALCDGRHHSLIHGRVIWGEIGEPNYGIYDRALGAMYMVNL